VSRTFKNYLTYNCKTDIIKSIISQIIKEIIMKRIGAFVGKFVPPHLGHVEQIKKCAAKVDELRVVVAENPIYIADLCAKDNLPLMSGDLRVGWLKDYFKDYKNIKVLYMDEWGLKQFPEGLNDWSDKFKDIAGHDINVKFADETYRELNEKYFPECEFVAFDRTVIPISATMIRKEPKKYFDYIIPQAQDFFKNIINENK
jgi:HTH-type transcriptional repressor of NAD biosynthesis genes